MREAPYVVGVFIVCALVRATASRPLISLHREKWIPLDLTAQDQVILIQTGWSEISIYRPVRQIVFSLHGDEQRGFLLSRVILR